MLGAGTTSYYENERILDNGGAPLRLGLDPARNNPFSVH